jgi:hypothetical protein
MKEVVVFPLADHPSIQNNSMALSVEGGSEGQPSQNPNVVQAVTNAVNFVRVASIHSISQITVSFPSSLSGSGIKSPIEEARSRFETFLNKILASLQVDEEKLSGKVSIVDEFLLLVEIGRTMEQK